MAVKTIMIMITVFVAGAYTLMMIYFPHHMLNPGDLAQGHMELEHDCFACHTAFVGIPQGKCLQCHPVDRIGLFTTKGTPVANQRPAFHHRLTTQDCMACHSDHLGRTISPIVFSHDLLADTLAHNCHACHVRPDDRLHANLTAECHQCHRTAAWKPAHFDHGTLTTGERNNCVACHEKPFDALHKSLAEACADCHTTRAWKPAHFQHDRYFRFDRDHQTECATCHAYNDYSSYTCYGCHEHTPAKVRDEHVEEGIRDFADCIRCHRSGNKHETEGRTKGDKRREHNDDD